MLGSTSALVPFDKAPVYAILVHLGNLGTKGVFKTDAQARVLDLVDRSVPGLYAAGNAPGTAFGNCCRAAMVFGYIAAEAMATERSGEGMTRRRRRDRRSEEMLDKSPAVSVCILCGASPGRRR